MIRDSTGLDEPDEEDDEEEDFAGLLGTCSGERGSEGGLMVERWRAEGRWRGARGDLGC
jgi:hypothetical protein